MKFFLEKSIKIMNEKKKIYGHSYLTYGKIMNILFPEGIKIESEDDWNTIGVFNMILEKVIRLSNNLFDKKNIPLDSSEDLIVYAAMLCEVLIDE